MLHIPLLRLNRMTAGGPFGPLVEMISASRLQFGQSGGRRDCLTADAPSIDFVSDLLQNAEHHTVSEAQQKGKNKLDPISLEKLNCRPEVRR
jgi:hypothetical protein